jgi:hypothetical protein
LDKKIKYYAGIGSRETPDPILKKMINIAKYLQNKGFILRSGGATGADTFFEKGAGNLKEIFLPWDNFNGRRVDNEKFFLYKQEAKEIAAKFHPKWKELSTAARHFHSRNVHQILGRNLDDPVEMVICWTKGGKMVGGTAQALRIAKEYKIKIYNLANQDFM